MAEFTRSPEDVLWLIDIALWRAHGIRFVDAWAPRVGAHSCILVELERHCQQMEREHGRGWVNGSYFMYGGVDEFNEPEFEAMYRDGMWYPFGEPFPRGR